MYWYTIWIASFLSGVVIVEQVSRYPTAHVARDSSPRDALATNSIGTRMTYTYDNGSANHDQKRRVAKPALPFGPVAKRRAAVRVR
jgi:hypothetical protein